MTNPAERKPFFPESTPEQQADINARFRLFVFGMVTLVILMACIVAFNVMLEVVTMGLTEAQAAPYVSVITAGKWMLGVALASVVVGRVRRYQRYGAPRPADAL